jgi:hypothetical protein
MNTNIAKVAYEQELGHHCLFVHDDHAVLLMRFEGDAVF